MQGCFRAGICSYPGSFFVNGTKGVRRFIYGEGQEKGKGFASLSECGVNREVVRRSTLSP